MKLNEEFYMEQYSGTIFQDKFSFDMDDAVREYYIYFSEQE